MSLLDRVTLFRGGLDLVSPKLAMQPGTVVGAKNYEGDVDGYRRSSGYERFDGRARPSEAEYWILDYTRQDIGGFSDAYSSGFSGNGIAALSGAFEVGNIVNGETSGARAYVLLVDTDAQFLVLGDLTGTFIDGENLQVIQAFSDEFTLEFQ